MADFNRNLTDLQNKTGRIQTDLISLLKDYEGVYSETNAVYIDQRMKTGNEGLDEFYKLLLTLKRNRDILGSLAQGMRGTRPLDHFKFVEDDLLKETPKKSPAMLRKQKAKETVKETKMELSSLFIQDIESNPQEQTPATDPTGHAEGHMVPQGTTVSEESDNG